jgi:arylsulfatase A-like enzyme
MLRRLLDSPRTYYALAGILLVVAVLTQFEISTPTRPKGRETELASMRTRDDVNVLFILIDALRADRLHAYGYARETSPWMDDLARTGVRFGRVVSQSSWTKSSMASLWTATYPVRNGILRWGHGLPEETPLPAERLREAGFHTAGIFRNGWVTASFGFDQGFQGYILPKPSVAPDKRSPRSHERLKGSDEDTTQAALEFLRTYGTERFMLYLHYMDVHQYTYSESSALFGTSYSDAYDNAIHWTDQNIGALLRELDARGLRNRTVVVIASDHGEEFLEHGGEGHARTLYREVVEVPWIVSLPFRLEPGVVVQATVGNVDIWPTLLDLLGVPALPETDGRSRLPLIEAALRGAAGAEATPQDDSVTFFSQLDRRWGRTEGPSRPLVAVTQGPFRLIVPMGTEGGDAVELFDHRVDPGERKNIAADHPEIAARLKEQADAYFGRPPLTWGSPLEVEISDLERGQLQALGYVLR